MLEVVSSENICMQIGHRYACDSHVSSCIRLCCVFSMRNSASSAIASYISVHAYFSLYQPSHSTFCKLNMILGILLQCKCGCIETQRPYLHGTSAAYSHDFRVSDKFHHISVPYNSFRYFPMNVCANQHQASSPFSFVSSASPARQPLPRNRMPKGHLAWVYARARAIWQRNDRLLIQTEH